MTEKRFTVHTMLEDYQVGEDDLKGHMVEILDNGNHMTYKECCNKLNTFYEENQLIKKHIRKLYKFVKIDVDNEIEVYPEALLGYIGNILKIIGD